MTHFDWQQLMRVGVTGLGLSPRSFWQLTPAEANIVRCDNILTEQDPDRLTFTLLPEGPRLGKTGLDG